MPELAILYPDDKPDPDLTFKRFGLPTRPSPPRWGLGRCFALARLCGVALG